MDQLIPSLAALVDGFRPCFRTEVFATFQHVRVGWIICPGLRTIREVWQATGRANTTYALFASASWDWDGLGRLLALVVVARRIPTGTVWLVVDATLGHKRGAKVCSGGFFLDAVTSTKKKNFRFGVNGWSWGWPFTCRSARTGASACRSSGGCTGRMAPPGTRPGLRRPRSQPGRWPGSSRTGSEGWWVIRPT